MCGRSTTDRAGKSSAVPTLRPLRRSYYYQPVNLASIVFVRCGAPDEFNQPVERWEWPSG